MIHSDEKEHGTQEGTLNSQLLENDFTPNCPVFVNTRFGKGSRARQNIKNVLREKAGIDTLDTADKVVFYRQYITSRFLVETIDEFYELANAADISILRIQIEVSTTLPIKEGHWYQIIRFCLFCWYLQSTPAVVFTSPVLNGHLDLFVLQNDRSLWKGLSEYQKTLFNRTVAMRIWHWLAKPIYVSYSINTLVDYFSEFTYQLFINGAIYRTISEYRVETFQQFGDCLQSCFGIELKYSIHRDYIANLKFRYERLPWLGADELSFNTSAIHSWINFNRLFRHEFMGERVFTHDFLE